MAERKLDKRFAYRVVGSTVGKIKIGDVHLYKQGKGPKHTELVFSTKGKCVSSFTLEKIGPCYVVGNKVQFEKPPLKRGELTRSVMSGEKLKRG